MAEGIKVGGEEKKRERGVFVDQEIFSIWTWCIVLHTLLTGKSMDRVILSSRST